MSTLLIFYIVFVARKLSINHVNDVSITKLTTHTGMDTVSTLSERNGEILKVHPNLISQDPRLMTGDGNNIIYKHRRAFSQPCLPATVWPAWHVLALFAFHLYRQDDRTTGETIRSSLFISCALTVHPCSKYASSDEQLAELRKPWECLHQHCAWLQKSRALEVEIHLQRIPFRKSHSLPQKRTTKWPWHHWQRTHHHDGNDTSPLMYYSKIVLHLSASFRIRPVGRAPNSRRSVSYGRRSILLPVFGAITNFSDGVLSVVLSDLPFCLIFREERHYRSSLLRYNLDQAVK